MDTVLMYPQYLFVSTVNTNFERTLNYYPINAHMHEIFLQPYHMKWVHRDPEKGNAQLARQNETSFKLFKLVYCLAGESLKCNSLAQKICMFL